MPDVLWDGSNLFVMIWKSPSQATLYKYTYDPLSKSHSLISGFPINIPLRGGSAPALVLEEDSKGKLWATYAGTEGPLADGNIHVIWSTSADHTVWNTTGAELESGLVPNIQEISAIVHFGGNKIGVVWSNRPGMEIAFRYHIDGEAETIWSAKEIVDSGLGPRGLGPVANDHLSIKAAADGHLFLVAKDHDNDGTPAHQNESRIWLYVRGLTGSWGSKTIVQPDLSQLPTRPVLLLDGTNNAAYVIYHDSASGHNFIAQSTLDNPAFSVPCPFSIAPASNPTSTKQNVSASSGLMAAASTGATASNEIVFRSIDLSPPPAPSGYECDLSPRPSGSNNGVVTIADWVQMGRFVAGLDLANAGEFQRADSAPRATRGDGVITIADWVQCGRYVAGLDPLTPAGGPTEPAISISKPKTQ
ncbi:MAG TPA: hypothetical protein VJ124_10395 [Pyrinomonadaceae bacterium]|nr:hypothetical protein [Pyrinomonadaceae bacterium]